MANRYDKPVNYGYVSQYVPIPFQELVTLGKYYADERKAAEEQLTQHLKSASDFNSLITKDNESYYNTVMNDNVMSVVDQLVKDPNLMKTSAGRQMLNSAINSVNYGDLAKLKASAKQAEMYQAAMQKLAIEGKMPPGWEPNYFDTYSTADSGVFNATPLAYETTIETIRPYVDNLKASYLYTDKGYDYFGVDNATVARQIDAFKSDILSNPINQRKMSQWMDAGATLEEAQALMLQQSYTAGLEATHKTREINPFSKINAQVNAAAEKAGLGGGNTPKNAVWFTQSMTADANIKHRKAVERIVSQKPEYEELRAAIAAAEKPDATKEQKEAGTKAEEQLKKMMESVTPGMAFRDTFIDGAGDISKGMTVEQSIAGTNNVINEYGAQIGAEYHDKLSGTIRGVSNKPQNTDVGKTYVVSGATNLMVAPYLIGSLAGYGFKEDGFMVKFNHALQSGEFGEMPIVGDGFVFGIPNGNNSNNYHGVSVAISQQAIEKAFKDYSSEEIEAILIGVGASTAYTRKSKSTSETEKPKVSWDDDVQYLTTTTTHVRGGEKYYILPTIHDIPSTGGGIAAETINNLIGEEQYSDAQRGNLQTYNWLLSNLQ